MQDHTKSLQDGTHYNVLLQRAWSKHGAAEFEFAVIEPCRTDELLVREQYWIDLLKVTDVDLGYNLAPTAGSALGIRWSDASKAARSAAMKEHFSNPDARKAQSEKIKAAFVRNPDLGLKLGRSGGAYRKGRPLSDEHKARIGTANRGHAVTLATRIKISATLKGRAGLTEVSVC